MFEYAFTKKQRLYLLFKRFYDLCLSLIAILIFLPIFILISLAIKIESNGPIFFVQKRVGKNQKVFNIIKFRTMVIGAEKIGDGLFVKGEQDKRITRIGRLLRRTSLDELPQLFNVAVGTMSLIGPRPPVTYYPYKIGEYDSMKAIRFCVRPGISGLAQVTTRTNASWDDRILLDVEYVKNASLFLDIKIIGKTLKSVMFNRNIYPDVNIDNGGVYAEK